MRTQHTTFLFLLMFLICVTVSCKSSDEMDVEFRDGISVPVWELLGDDLIFVLENDLEFPIYRGENPPDVEEMLLSSSSSPQESTVVLRPAFLDKSNVPGESNQTGVRYRDILIRIRNQNMKKLTVEFDRIVLGSSPYLGDESYIIGNGNQFTVFGKQENIVEQDTILSVNFFSGTVEDGGISSPMGGIIVLDNRGIKPFLPNGTGRIFTDGDGFADLEKWPSTGDPGVFGKRDKTLLKKN